MDHLQPHDFALGFMAIAFYVGVLAMLVIPYWMIWRRTGHAGAWGLLVLVPLANIISLWVLAFKEWPALSGGKTEPRP